VLQRDDENFSIAYDFCVQKAWFNTFPDVNPRETEELYARCTHQSLWPRVLAPAFSATATDTMHAAGGKHRCSLNTLSQA
jgi:hypothetical protein